MKEKETDPSVKVILGLLSLLLIVPSYLIRGFVITKLWAWFLTPAIGLAAPSIPIAIGIGILVSFLTHQDTYVEDKQTDVDKFLYNFSYLLLRPLVILLIGYIITLWV